VLPDVYAAIDCQQVTLLGLLDLSAAFDCVDYDILLRQLHLKFGICGTVLEWISSFLLGRSQQGQGTPVRQASAAFRSAVRVCPRPSVVPAVYGRVIRCYHRVWVHRPLVCRRHTSLCVSTPATDHSDATDRLMMCITRIRDWMASNRLKLNEEKTQIIWLGTRHAAA